MNCCFGLRARCAPQTLNDAEREKWLAECRKRLTQQGAATTTLEKYFEEIDSVRDRYETLLNEGSITEERYEAIEKTLSDLWDWGDQAAEYAQVEG